MHPAAFNTVENKDSCTSDPNNHNLGMFATAVSTCVGGALGHTLINSLLVGAGIGVVVGGCIWRYLFNHAQSRNNVI